MHAEQRFRNAFLMVWDADAHPIRKARQFLTFAHRAQRLGGHLMNLGFVAHHAEEWSRTKRLWAAAATFFTLADEARQHAKRALAGKTRGMGFDHVPQTYAVPNWEMNPESIKSPMEVTD